MGNTVIKQAPAQQTITEKDIETKKANLRTLIQRLQQESESSGFFLSDQILHYLEFLQPYPESHPTYYIRALTREDVLQEIASIVIEPHLFLPNQVPAVASDTSWTKKRPAWFHEKDFFGIHRVAFVRNLNLLPIHKRMYVDYDTTEVLVL